MTEQVLARAICKVHGRVIGHVVEREQRLVFIHRSTRKDALHEVVSGPREPTPLEVPQAMTFLRCSKCPRNRILSGVVLVRAARARGTATRVLV